MSNGNRKNENMKKNDFQWKVMRFCVLPKWNAVRKASLNISEHLLYVSTFSVSMWHALHPQLWCGHKDPTQDVIVAKM